MNIPDHILFFDGECVLCNRLMQFVFRKDKKNIFYFAHLQSEPGKKVKEQVSAETDTFIYVEKGKAFVKSTAVLKICRRLGGIYLLLYPLIFLPPFLRDPLYMLFSRHRYRWFGKYDTCLVPGENLRKRFLTSFSGA